MNDKTVSQTKIGIGLGLLLVFIFTASVFIGGVSQVQAQGNAGIESSYGNEVEEGGILESVKSFFKGIVSWIGETVGGWIGSVNAVFGFEGGEGSQAMFGGVFYFFLIIILLFAGKLVYNILRDTVKSVVPKGGPSRPRKSKEK